MKRAGFVVFMVVSVLLTGLAASAMTAGKPQASAPKWLAAINIFHDGKWNQQGILTQLTGSTP